MFVATADEVYAAVSTWTQHKCECTVRLYRSGNDSYAAVVQRNGFLQALRELTYFYHNVWFHQPNCQRMYAFYHYARKHHKLLSSAHQCTLRRLFLVISRKVEEFNVVFQKLRETGWDWSTVHPYTTWCPGGAGHHGHSMQVMAEYLATLRELYKEPYVLMQNVQARLEKHMCPDVAAHVMSFYSQSHV